MWLFEDKEFEDDTEGFYGFVYEIENLSNGKKYIGRKYFTKAGYKQKKGKIKKIRKTSDWELYYGSSGALKEDIEIFGKETFRRTILKLCKTRGECNYWESKFILERDAILDNKYYNESIQCRIHSSHVKHLLF
jgi:hypothetical protein